MNWPACAAALAVAVPRERLHPAVVAWAASRPPREKWAVAFSGGADSLALLLLLWAQEPQRRRSLVALHFDHRLRGRESRADAAFCRKVCAALGVTLREGAWTKAPRGASEAAARGARLAFFARRSRVLWLGHQQDDIAESMLMRLARGSGSGGLAAPRPLQPMPGGRMHVRPLLNLKKAELVEALRVAGARWREDSTNAGDDYFRNRIRARVIPAWARAAQRDALAGAARTRELLEDDDAALEHWLKELAPLDRDGALRVDTLAGKPRALLRRALHRWLAGQTAAGELARAGFDALLDAVAAGKATRRSLGRAGFAVIRRGRLRFQRVENTPLKFQRRAN